MCGKCCKKCRGMLKSAPLKIVPDAPVPGINGINFNQLQGQTCCLTGRFFEFVDVPGACSRNCKCLNLGKPEARVLISNFKGKSVLDISGTVNFLVIGDEPGKKKVQDAKTKFIPIIHMKVYIYMLSLYVSDTIIKSDTRAKFICNNVCTCIYKFILLYKKEMMLRLETNTMDAFISDYSKVEQITINRYQHIPKPMSFLLKLLMLLPCLVELAYRQ